MAVITDPTAIRFTNEKVRVMADAMAQAYFTAKSLVAEWNAVGMSSKITNTADLISDGSATDGRNPLTGAAATSVITRAQELITDYEANSGAKLNTILSAAVNHGARF